MDSLRVIDFEMGDAPFNMALDEAIARSVGGGTSPPTLRLYGWDPSAVSIGYFQEIREEVNLEFCQQRGIQVVRRLTGGGAVLHSPGELTYSFIACESELAVPQDIQGSYIKICSPIVNALRRLGVDASFKPINDIEIKGRKISGSAQTRRFGSILQHGTVLIDMDTALLGALKVSHVKLKEKKCPDVAGRITTLKELLKRDMRHCEVTSLVVKEFERQFKCRTFHEPPNDTECGLIMTLEERYRSIDWLFRR